MKINLEYICVWKGHMAYTNRLAKSYGIGKVKNACTSCDGHNYLCQNYTGEKIATKYSSRGKK